MSKKTLKLGLILLITTFIISGCTLPWKKGSPAPIIPVTTTPDVTEPRKVAPEIPKTNDIKEFASQDELKLFLEENMSGSSGTMYAEMDFSTRGEATNMIQTAMPMAANKDVATSNSSNSDAGASFDYSLTNNQVVGVDEADIIKTDGNYAYVLVRNELSIIKINPIEEAQVVSKITFSSRPLDIFIKGTSLVVFGSNDQVFRSFARQSNYTFFKVFNLSDPTSPRQVRDLNFEGNYTDSRMIGDYIYFVTNNYANYIEGEPLTPRILSGGNEIENFSPSVFYFDIPYNNYNYTSITAINVEDSEEEVTGQVYLLDGGQNFYVSQNNIYITYTEYLSEYDIEREVKETVVYPALATEEQEKITEINNAPTYILNAREKKAKINLIIEKFLASLDETEKLAWGKKLETAFRNELLAKAKDREKTVIHKIGIKDNVIEYKAKGEVSGQVLNQFSMDENGDYFRIATTRSRLWSQLTESPEDSYSNIYILGPDLTLVGSLENLATTERIYSARFMGDRVYLVTFRQVDPLYVINLSDPQKPTVLGAIKVPGYSNYLHPVDASGTQLIGLGRETEIGAGDQVIVKGLKLSLFDFSDLSKPKELDSYIIGDSYSDSIALFDHKAFLYSGSKNIISIPAVLRENNGRLAFAGALVFSLENNALSLKGRIDHSEGGHFTTADNWRGYNYYDNTVKRSMYVGDNLVTFSNKFLKVNRISDLSSVKDIKLTPDSPDDFIIDTPEPTPVPEDVEDMASPDETLPGSPLEPAPTPDPVEPPPVE